jgi:TRAP-type uncharacterized transport system substrate-binding protein
VTAAARLLGSALVGVALLAPSVRAEGGWRTSLTAGESITSRAVIARALAAELTAHGIETEVVDCESTRCELEHVQARKVDFAMVSGAIERTDYPEIREVAPLYVEALHLLVKSELAPRFADGTLAALRGLRVDLGAPESATRWLSEDVLEFAEIPCTPARSSTTCGAEQVGLERLVRLEEGERRAGLPDAIFHLATVPSKLAAELIRAQDYAVVPLPFARAFRLAGMLSDEAGSPAAKRVGRRYTTAYELPAYLYGLSPPNPAAPLATIGARLLLVAHRDLAPEHVEAVVEVMFGSRFAHVPDPALHPSMFRSRPHGGLHDGTLDYLARGKPIVDASDVDRIANTLSVLGALLGAGVFVWQAWRQRRRAARDRIFGGCQLEIAAVERRIAELELSAQLDLDALVELQRKVLQLKTDALTRFAAGELGEPETLVDLLSPLNDARDHVGDLLLHVRDAIEKKAREEGRTAEAVWEETIEGGGSPGD